jgi:hypothetical protein
MDFQRIGEDNHYSSYNGYAFWIKPVFSPFSYNKPCTAEIWKIGEGNEPVEWHNFDHYQAAVAFCNEWAVKNIAPVEPSNDELLEFFMRNVNIQTIRDGSGRCEVTMRVTANMRQNHIIAYLYKRACEKNDMRYKKMIDMLRPEYANRIAQAIQ